MPQGTNNAVGGPEKERYVSVFDVETAGGVFDTVTRFYDPTRVYRNVASSAPASHVCRRFVDDALDGSITLTSTAHAQGEIALVTRAAAAEFRSVLVIASP